MNIYDISGVSLELETRMFAFQELGWKFDSSYMYSNETPFILNNTLFIKMWYFSTKHRLGLTESVACGTDNPRIADTGSNPVVTIHEGIVPRVYPTPIAIYFCPGHDEHCSGGVITSLIRCPL